MGTADEHCQEGATELTHRPKRLPGWYQGREGAEAEMGGVRTLLVQVEESPSTGTSVCESLWEQLGPKHPT